MGTIRKVSGEFFFRKDGASYKFMNQEEVKNRFPDYSDPIPIDDDEVTIIFDFVELVTTPEEDKQREKNFLSMKKEKDDAFAQVAKAWVNILEDCRPVKKGIKEQFEADFEKGTYRELKENEIIVYASVLMSSEQYKADLRKAFDAGEFGELSFEQWYKHFIGQ